MVKKKSRRKIIKAPVPKLDTIFNCPKCGHKKTVAVTLNKKTNDGFLKCKACKIEYQTKFKRADAFIDIYYKWVDELEKQRLHEEEEEEHHKKKREKEDDDDEQESERNDDDI